MKRTLLIATCALVVLPVLTGCKIVKNPTAEEAALSEANMTDAERMAALVAREYTPRVVPHMETGAKDIGAVLDAIGQDLDTAGESLGIPKASEGSPWNFIAKGEGKVVASNRDSRAAKLEVDVTEDGAADLSIQLGPVIKGTALRDSANFYVFTEFRDQIEFAKLARALNDTAGAAISLPDGDLVGETVSFTGAFSLAKASDPVLLVPVVLSTGGDQ
ncbi:DUF2291 domain-containing protein [Tropicimonas sp. TH_r6]|uniref:DUF2291 family protein n=1 Tax=Tropicimonas sp. TH_r6 TaxID=3082085 RepID=UPI002953E290|nr:DUF2291 domain-containing protein [Tropicimonas sp. TH_r6]MDV7144850.1 DUF2291 domain-containing protein [Tropicimonas sp. TH_r6]